MSQTDVREYAAHAASTQRRRRPRNASGTNRTGSVAAHAAYELCSAWFLIALSMPEKIIA